MLRANLGFLLSMALPTVSALPTISSRKLESTYCTSTDQQSGIWMKGAGSKVFGRNTGREGGPVHAPGSGARASSAFVFGIGTDRSKVVPVGRSG